MKSLILNFLLLVLRILLDFCPNANYKDGRFSKALLEKNLKFVPSRRVGNVALNLSLVLLLAEVDSILEKQSYKRDTLRAHGTGRIKIILGLSIKVVALHVGPTMV